MQSQPPETCMLKELWTTGRRSACEAKAPRPVPEMSTGHSSAIATT
jgi:hypothetical protein